MHFLQWIKFLRMLHLVAIVLFCLTWYTDVD